MKKMKRLWAALLTLAMVLGMSMTTMAAAPNPATDVKTVDVENLEPGVTVTAYQFIKATYNETNDGFTGYEWLVDGDSNSNVKAGDTVTIKTGTTDEVVGLTSDFITKLAASDLTKLKNITTATADANGKATLSLKPGTWLILVTSGTDTSKVYNPMVASVYYAKSGSDNTMDGDSVDASEKWTLETTGAYAKTSDLTITKTVDDDTKEIERDRTKTENIAKSEKATFTVNTTIPSYSDAYLDTGDHKLTFEIKDTINAGLRYCGAPKDTVQVTAPKKTVNGVSVDAERGTDYTVTYYDKDEKELTTDKYETEAAYFIVSFSPAYLKSLAAATDRAVTITYKAFVTTAASVVTPGENTVTLTYSDTPSSTKDKTASEKVYTFDLDGDNEGGAFTKVKEDKTTPLARATFTLYRTYENGKLDDAFGSYTTGDDGTIRFHGLGALEKDAQGDVKENQSGTGAYYLKETEAPAPYTVNDTIYKVEVVDIIRASATDDTVTGYTVKVSDPKTGETIGTTTFTVSSGKIQASGSTVNIVNTKIINLPSTGGIGTTIFTIGGCVIMIAAAFLFFANRRKSSRS